MLTCPKIWMKLAANVEEQGGGRERREERRQRNKKSEIHTVTRTERHKDKETGAERNRDPRLQEESVRLSETRQRSKRYNGQKSTHREKMNTGKLQ